MPKINNQPHAASRRLATRRQFLKTSAAAAGLSLVGAPFIARSGLAQSSISGKKIGYSMSFSTIEWLVAQRRGVTETAARYGFDVSVSDAGDKPAKKPKTVWNTT